MRWFRSYPKVQRLVSAGSTRGTVVLRSGLQVDLRVVRRESYGAALCYFTGSKAHNVAVRRRGVERNLRINEYGIFEGSTKRNGSRAREAEGKRVGGAEENEIYRAVGLDWVAPELFALHELQRRPGAARLAREKARNQRASVDPIQKVARSAQAQPRENG